MNNLFSIGVGGKAVAAFFQFGAQLGEIVDLSVESHPDRPVLVEDGLVPSGQVDDAEAAHSKDAAILDKDSVIRTSVHNSLAHAVDCAGFNLVADSRAHNTRDSTHTLSSHASTAAWLRRN